MAITINLTQLRRKKREKDGKVPIYIRITEDGKSRFKSTGIYLEEKYWNRGKQKVSKSHRHHEHLNIRLKRNQNEVEDIREKLYKENKLSLDELMKVLHKDKESDPRSVLTLGKEFQSHLKSIDKYWEMRHFTVIINNLNEFIREKNKSDQLDKLDAEWIEGFQDYLLREIGNSNNTVRKKLQRFKAMTDWLIKENHISDNPFIKVEKVEPKKINNKVKLTIEQIQAIENLELEKGSQLWHVKNYFLFSFYNAGIRFGDLCTLRWRNLVDGRLVYEMRKTGGKKNIRQLEPMRKILDRYLIPTSKPGHYIFPLLKKNYRDPIELRKIISSKNARVNKLLKTLAKKSGIESNVSFHVSRHTWAHYALKKGMDLYSISKALGHADLKITEEYIKSFDEEMLDKSMESLYS